VTNFCLSVEISLIWTIKLVYWRGTANLNLIPLNGDFHSYKFKFFLAIFSEFVVKFFEIFEINIDLVEKSKLLVVFRQLMLKKSILDDFDLGFFSLSMHNIQEDPLKELTSTIDLNALANLIFQVSSTVINIYFLAKRYTPPFSLE